MRTSGGVLTLALASALLLGCVDRRYVITTDPPGAVVYRNGQYLGATPVDDHFIYYGKYHFSIVKEGYEELQIDQDISTPWYEYPPIDFFSETLLPYNVIDRREFHYKLEPRKLPDQALMLQQAANLREKGKALKPGKPTTTPAQTPPTGMLPNVEATTNPYVSPLQPIAPPPGVSTGVGGVTPLGPAPKIPVLENSTPPVPPGAAGQQNPQR